MKQMEPHLEGLEEIFDTYKRKMMQADQENKRKFANFKATERRRRKLKKKIEEETEKKVRNLVIKLTQNVRNFGKIIFFLCFDLIK